MEKRKAFGHLITLLFKLGATRYVHIPVVSNAYHLEDYENLMGGLKYRTYR